MHKREFPQGYIESFETHNQPAQSKPPPPIIQQKQAETLMGHSLKELIKERLYGELINYTRHRNPKNIKFTPPILPLQKSSPSIAKSTSAIPENKSLKISQFRTGLERRMELRHESVIKKHSNNNNSYSLRSDQRYSLPDLEETVLMRSNNYRKMPSISGRNKSQSEKKKDNSVQIQQKNKYTSFLSAIEEDDPQQGNASNNQRLSPLLKKPVLNERLEKIKIVNKSPGISRLEMQNYEIDSNFWERVCKKQKSNIENNQIEQYLKSGVNPSVNSVSKILSPIVSLPSRSSQLITMASLEKSKLMSPSKIVLRKENFQEYINSPKWVEKRLLFHLLSFFELNGKIGDDLKINDYKKIMEGMVNSGWRVWAFCAFRFCDKDRNGLICNNDLFSLFKYLDALETQLKEDYQQIPDSLAVVQELKSLVSDIQNTIITQSFDMKLKPCSGEEINVEIKYLEESIIRKKEVVVSELVLILGPQMNKNTVKDSKREVIETVKQVRTKLSSCYRYSFLATDHNEQTREDRDQIQNLKESLKREKIEMIEKERQNSLINKKLTGIDYSTFIKHDYHKVVRKLAFQFLGIKQNQ